jgi:hypothetical protein
MTSAASAGPSLDQELPATAREKCGGCQSDQDGEEVLHEIRCQVSGVR